MERGLTLASSETAVVVVAIAVWTIVERRKRMDRVGDNILLELMMRSLDQRDES